MSNIGRHGRNLSWLFAADLFNKIVALFYFAYLSRKISVVENGWYGTFLALMPLLMVLNTFGFNDVVVREVSRSRERVHALMATGLLLQTALFAVLIPAVCFAARALHYGTELQTVVLYSAIAAFLWALMNLHLAVIAAYELFKYISYITILMRIVTVVGSVALLYAGFGILAVLAFVLPATLFQVLLVVLTTRRMCVPYHFAPSLADAKYLIKEGFPMALGRFAGASYYRMDVPLLNSFAQDVQAPGHYSIATRFYVLLATVMDNLETVFYPILSRKSAESQEAQTFALERMLKLVVLIALPMFVGMAILADNIVVTLAGEKFAPGADATAVLTGVLALSMIDRTIVTFLRARTKQHLPLACYGTACILKLAFCLWAIPRHGIVSLLVINIVISALMTAVMLGIARNELPKLGFIRITRTVFLRPLVAAGAMAVAILQLQALSIFVSVPIGFVVYGISLMLLGTVDEFDKQMIRETLRKNRSQE